MGSNRNGKESRIMGIFGLVTKKEAEAIAKKAAKESILSLENSPIKDTDMRVVDGKLQVMINGNWSSITTRKIAELKTPALKKAAKKPVAKKSK